LSALVCGLLDELRAGCRRGNAQVLVVVNGDEWKGKLEFSLLAVLGLA